MGMRAFRAVVLSAGVVLGPGQALGGGLLAQELGSPRNATSQAGATASAYDASTAWYNAAGMARIDRPLLMVGVQPIFTEIEFDSSSHTTYSGGDGGDAGGFLPSSGGFYVRPLNERWSLGGSFVGISGAGLDYDGDWVGRYNATDVNLMALALTPSVSYRINEWLSVGVGVSIAYATFEQKIKLPRLSNLIDESTVRNRFEQMGSAVRASLLTAAKQKAAGFEPPPWFDRLPEGVQDRIIERVRQEAKSALREVGNEISARARRKIEDSGVQELFEPGPDGEIELDGDDWELSWNVGLLFEPTDRTRVGLVFFDKVDFQFEGDGEINQSTPLTNALGLSAADIEIDLPLPRHASLGVYHLLTDRLAIMSDVGWEQWSDLDTLPISGEYGNTIGIELEWKDTWNASLGFEYQLPGWRLQAGVRYDSSPVKNANLNYVFLPMDRQWRFSGGVVYDWSETKQIGLSYTFADLGNARVSNTSALGTLRGSYDKNQAHFVAISYQF